MVSKYFLAQLNLESVSLEATQSKILRSNLLAARKELMNSNAWGSSNFLSSVNGILGELDQQQIRNFGVGEIYQQGSQTGRLIVAQSAEIPPTSLYWQWQPILPLSAISAEKDLFADLIRKSSIDLKKDILRQTQISIAMGEGLQERKDRILGTGLQGLKGKDGVFRSATNRSEAIARTVSNSLLNKGALNTYNQVDLIVPELNLRKQWVTVSDNRTSKRCLSLSGQIRELVENFIASDGWQGQSPPSHPYCRSRVVSVGEKYSNHLESRWTNEGGKLLTVKGLSRGF